MDVSLAVFSLTHHPPPACGAQTEHHGLIVQTDRLLHIKVEKTRRITLYSLDFIKTTISVMIFWLKI